MTAPDGTDLGIADNASSVPAVLKLAGALATFSRSAETLALKDDMTALSGVWAVPPPLLHEQAATLPLPLLNLGEGQAGHESDWLGLPGGGFIVPGSSDRRSPPALGPIIRSLAERELENIG